MKTALITGALGGMGKATVKELIRLGYEVYGLDIKEAEEFKGFHYYKSDLTSEKSISDTFALIKEKVDHFDVIIHLSGIYDLNSLVEMSEKDFISIFDINVFACYRINKIFLPLLKENSKIIITTSELAPLDPLPFTGIYGISKTTLEKYAYSLRMELQLLNIKVIVVRPGAVDTGLLNVSLDKLEKFKQNTTHYVYNAKKFYEIVNKVESKKIPPEKIARVMGKIINKKKPKYLYNINRNPLLKLLNVLPRRMQNHIIKRILTK